MRRRALLALLLASLSLPALARADDAAVAEAKQRFDEGLKLVDAGRHDEARLKFQQAAAVLKAPAVLFNLARAEQLTGHDFEALEHFKAFLRASENDPKITDSEREKARQNIAALVPSVGQIDVAAPPNARISIDGKVREEPAREPIAVPPGRHVVEVTFEGRVKSMNVECVRGEVTKAAFEFEPAPTAAASTPTTEPPPATEHARDDTRWIVGGALGGAGVVALGLGIGFGLSSQSSKSDAEDLRRRFPGLCASPALPECADYDDKRSSAESAATVSTVAYVASGLLVAGAVATVLLWPHPKEGHASSASSAARALVPWASRDGAGAALTGSF